MSARFGHSSLHQRDARSALFDSYTGDRSSRSGSPASFAGSNPRSRSAGYGFAAPGAGNGNGSAHANANGSAGYDGFRSATPNRKGQYSAAVLEELESQNDEHVEGMSSRIRALKEVATAIGDEVRSSSALAEQMNESFDRTRVRLRGTMNRMLRMAERSGIGWRVWLGFFAAVFMLFFYVWLF